MPYTVWCNDRLVGETDLDYIANTSERKFGDFEATDYGREIIPVLMAPRQAICAHAPMEEVRALFFRREQVQLELRAPDGRVIPTEFIEITDLEWLLTLGGDDRDEDWQDDMAIAEAELSERLCACDVDDGERLDALPPEWLDEEEMNEDSFDEFDVPDLEFGDEFASPPDFPRFQIHVGILGGG